MPIYFVQNCKPGLMMPKTGLSMINLRRLHQRSLKIICYRPDKHQGAMKWTGKHTWPSDCELWKKSLPLTIAFFRKIFSAPLPHNSFRFTPLISLFISKQLSQVYQFSITRFLSTSNVQLVLLVIKNCTKSAALFRITAERIRICPYESDGPSWSFGSA